jgi:hypothetical protein
MKKGFILMLSAAALLTACSSNDELSSLVNGGGTSNNGVPISIGTSVTSAKETRGAGTVGGIADNANVWSGQKVYVYMVNKGTSILAADSTDKKPIYENAALTTPSDTVTGEAARTDGTICYYPAKGIFDFWGYYINDAAKNYDKNNTPVATIDGDSIYVPFKIDGSQDLMTAKAAPSAKDLSNTTADSCYSAHAARRNVQPNLTFKHQLTRLTFSISANSAKEADPSTGVNVDSIKVLTKSSGKLVIIPTDKKMTEGYIVYDENQNLDSVTLKDRTSKDLTDNLTKLASTKPDPTGSKTLGEALLVAPADSMTFVIFCSQNVLTSTSSTELSLKSFAYSAKVAGPQDGGGIFEKGKSYNVNIKIYGLEQIKINTTLEAWKDGGSISIDEDN